MESVWSVSKLSTESVGSRRQLVANCDHTADADATKQFRLVGVGGVYWALEISSRNFQGIVMLSKGRISSKMAIVGCLGGE